MKPGRPLSSSRAFTYVVRSNKLTSRQVKLCFLFDSHLLIHSNFAFSFTFSCCCPSGFRQDYHCLVCLSSTLRLNLPTRPRESCDSTFFFLFFSTLQWAPTPCGARHRAILRVCGGPFLMKQDLWWLNGVHIYIFAGCIAAPFTHLTCQLSDPRTAWVSLNNICPVIMLFLAPVSNLPQGKWILSKTDRPLVTTRLHSLFQPSKVPLHNFTLLHRLILPRLSCHS